MDQQQLVHKFKMNEILPTINHLVPISKTVIDRVRKKNPTMILVCRNNNLSFF